MAVQYSILIVDDSAAYRHQLRLAMESIDGIRIAGEASDGRSALRFLQFNKVDCIILDIEMPEMNGIDVVKEIRKSNSSCKVIMFSSINQRAADATILALSAGANDFVPKPIASHYPANLSPSQIIRSVLEPKL